MIPGQSFHKRSISLLLPVFCLAFILHSCSKSSDNEPDPPVGDNCRLDSIIGALSYGTGSSYVKNKFLYDNQNRSTNYLFDATNSQTYSYASDGKLKFSSIISGAITKEQRELHYDAQGRITGYTSVPHPTNTTAPDKLDITYTDALITFTYLKNNDTLSQRFHHYENGNNVRTEYYQLDYLVKIDSTTYGSEVPSYFPSKEIDFLITGKPLSKNLPTRHITFDVTTGKRSWLENYSYQIDNKGKITQETTVANTLDPSLNYNLIRSMYYSCK